MSWTLNPAIVGNHMLRSTFATSQGGMATYKVDTCMPFAGNMPLVPTETSGITPLCASQKALSGLFYSPSDGVTSLSTQILLTPNTSGTLSFIRLYATGVPVADISCSLIASDNSAVASTLTIVSGTTFAVTDLRMKINTTGGVSVNPAVANDFLFKMIGITPSYGYTSYFFETFQPSGTQNVTVKLYSGSVPSRADSPPSGTELWAYLLPVSTALFLQSGLGVSLRSTLIATATTSGIPTYCRIKKDGYVTGGTVFPEAIIQVPVTTDGPGCTLSASSFTSGQSYSIAGLTLTLQ